MTDEERFALRSTRSAGLAFAIPRSDIGHHVLHSYRLHAVVLAADGASARVLRATNVVTIAYPVVRHGGAWRCALGPLERVDRPPRDEDRERPLLEPETGEPPIGLKLLGGPPQLTDEEREAVFAAVRELVSRHRGSDARLYCVRLEADGREGRMVFTNGEQTESLDILREGGKWVHKGGHSERALRIPFPDDRDGWLNR